MADVVVLVHGIRTRAGWMSDIRPVLQQAGFTVVPTSYGRFNLLRFLCPFPWFRKKAVDRIRQQISEAISTNQATSISVIAHSFGTYVVSEILASEPSIKWKRIIFAGSVVPEDFPFLQYGPRFVQANSANSPILNEVGTRDFLPALASSITWGYGYIGSFGLNDALVENRFRKGLSHSDFLTPSFVATNWVPFLNSQMATAGDMSQSSWLSRLVSMVPLRYLLTLLLLIQIVGWRYIWVMPVDVPANLWPTYKFMTANDWREKQLHTDGQFYVLVASGFPFSSYPTLNKVFAQLEAFRIRRRFPNIDVEVVPTANLMGENKQAAVILSRSTQEYDACVLRTTATKVGIAEDAPAYVYQLNVGLAC